MKILSRFFISSLLILVTVATVSAQPEKPYCVLEAEATFNRDIPSAIIGYNCFDTYVQAAHFATDGAISLDASRAEAALAIANGTYKNRFDLFGTSSIGSGGLIVAELHDWRNRSGPSTFIKGNYRCSSGAGYYFPNLNTYGWGNRIESIRMFEGCKGSWIYDGTNASGFFHPCDAFSGNLDGYYYCDSLDVLNNRGESLFLDP